MSFPISAPPLEPQIRGHFYPAPKGTLSFGYNRMLHAGDRPRKRVLEGSGMLDATDLARERATDHKHSLETKRRQGFRASFSARW